MKKMIVVAVIAAALTGCIGTGRPRCRRFYGLAVPFVAVGVWGTCQ